MLAYIAHELVVQFAIRLFLPFKNTITLSLYDMYSSMFVGIKVMDQDGDGKVDLNDFAIAKRKVKDFFDKSKKETN